MNMNIAQSVQELINMPTVDGGGRKSRNWLTNLHQALTQGDLSISMDGDKVLVNGVPIDTAVAIVQSLEPIGNGGFTGEKLTEYLVLHAKGMPSALALSASKKAKKETFVRSPKSVLSANEYRLSRIRESLAAIIRDNEFIESLATMSGWDWDDWDKEKDSAIKYFMAGFLETVFPADAREIYTISREKERRRAQKWDELYISGFNNLKLLENGHMVGEISFVNAKEGAKVLEREGYRTLARLPNIEEESFVVEFVEVIPQTDPGF